MPERPVAPGPDDHAVEVPFGPDETLDAVRDAAEVWGAEWRRLGRGGRIELPVSAGLRYGIVGAEIACRERSGGSVLELQVEETAYRVHLPALSVIAAGAAGAVAMILAPLVPGLFALVPVGLIVMVCSWFLVLSRLQHRGPREFLELVLEIARHPIEAEPEPGEQNDDETSGSVQT